MSPQILLVLAAILVAGALVGILLRGGPTDRGTTGGAETPGEPGSEGMRVVGDGDISPGPEN